MRFVVVFAVLRTQKLHQFRMFDGPFIIGSARNRALKQICRYIDVSVFDGPLGPWGRRLQSARPSYPFGQDAPIFERHHRYLETLLRSQLLLPKMKTEYSDRDRCRRE